MPVISNPKCHVDFPFVVFGIAHSHTQKLTFSHFSPTRPPTLFTTGDTIQ